MSSALSECCETSRRGRVPILIGPRAESSMMTPMLYGLILRYAPTRIVEINKTLFGAMLAETPFWGLYESIRCSNPNCARELHVLLIDGQMLMVIDQVVRQLYDLIEGTDDLTFRQARVDERARARRI